MHLCFVCVLHKLHNYEAQLSYSIAPRVVCKWKLHSDAVSSLTPVSNSASGCNGCSFGAGLQTVQTVLWRGKQTKYSSSSYPSKLTTFSFQLDVMVNIPSHYWNQSSPYLSVNHKSAVSSKKHLSDHISNIQRTYLWETHTHTNLYHK